MPNIYEAVLGSANGHDESSSIAAVDLGKDGKAISYAQLQRCVDGVRAAASIKSGDKVGLVMPNSLELIIGLLAVWAEGAATAPLNPAYTATEFKVSLLVVSYIITSCGY